MESKERNALVGTVAMHVGNGLEDAQMDIGGANLSRDEYIEIVAKGIFDALLLAGRGDRAQVRAYAEHVVHEMRNISGIDG